MIKEPTSGSQELHEKPNASSSEGRVAALLLPSGYQLRRDPDTDKQPVTKQAEPI